MRSTKRRVFCAEDQEGAQAYITKPGNIFELVNTITQLINQQERAGHEERVNQEECSPTYHALLA